MRAGPRADDACYADMRSLPHPEPPPGRRRMPLHARAAQFSPFAALTGHDDVLRETARLTEQPVSLDENEQAVLDLRLQLLRSRLPEQPEAVFTWFQPDARKPGGVYRTACGRVAKIDETAGLLILADRTHIPVAQLRCIEGDLFQNRI